MHRLFVAIRPPAPMRAILLAALGGVTNARWQNEDQLHLTIRFIGEVDRHLAEDIAAVLGSVRHREFALALNGVGQFDHKGRVDSLWAGITPSEPLAALHRKVGHALMRAGVAPDGRAFLPHITLARINRSTGPLQEYFADHGGLASPAEPIRDFALYESALGKDGSAYSIVARYPLEPAGP